MNTSKRPTIRDVAKASGVSTMAVSYVLNDRPGKVGRETRERIKNTIKELHYRPSAVARGLSRRRLNAIGVIFHVRASTKLVSTPYFGDILGGILESSMEHSQSTTLFTEVGDADHGNRLNAYCDGRCDGLIFVAPRDRANLVAALANQRVPHVFISDLGDDPQTSYVDVDNLAAAKKAMEYLIERGHRRIALLGGDDDQSSAQRRREGYLLAMEEAGIEVDLTLVHSGKYSPKWGYDGTERLLELSGKRPTAIFCASDEIALGALVAARMFGVSVPDDLSIMGFDDTTGAATSNPPLTTVRQPLHRIGCEAVELLLEMIDSGEMHGQRRILESEIITRGTVAPPRGAVR